MTKMLRHHVLIDRSDQDKLFTVKCSPLPHVGHQQGMHSYTAVIMVCGDYFLAGVICNSNLTNQLVSWSFELSIE